MTRFARVPVGWGWYHQGATAIKEPVVQIRGCGSTSIVVSKRRDVKKLWVIEQGVYGPRIVMQGPWSKAALKAAQRVEAKEIELNYAKGWSGKDLRFLRDLPELEAFEIIDWTTDDIGAVNELLELRRLEVSTYCKTELRFNEFPALEECALEWRPKASSIFEHQGIKRLFMNKYPGRDLTNLSQMTSLESLRLASPARLVRLRGVESLRKLTRLELSYATRLTSLAGVEKLTRLVALEINTCRKVQEITPVAGLRQLKELAVNNCGDIETIQPVMGLKDLESFLFWESTNVVDGDLSPLLGLPKLESVAFAERRHYSHTRNDLPA